VGDEPARASAGGALWTLARLFAFGGLFVVLALAGFALVPATGMDARAMLAQGAVTLVAALVAGSALLARLDGRAPAALGFGFARAVPRDFALGLGIGVGAIVIATVPLMLAGAMTYSREPGTVGTWTGALARDFTILGVAAAAEEALFRGYPFQVLVRAIGAVAATVLTSALFAFAHAGNPNVGGLALLNIGLAGVLLSAAYLRTRSLWFATAVHLGWNWGMASLLDLPVSGITSLETPLYEPRVGGPVWVTGGAFGPEGGIVASLAFLAALAAVLRLPRPALPAARARRAIIDGD
jgi:hypothetical protein